MLTAGAHEDLIKEAVRLAEKQLDAQLTIIGALAQRAGALAAMLGAGATAMLGAEILALNALRVEQTLGTYLAALLAPSLMFAGCAYCGMAAGTSKFQTSGDFPSSWEGNNTRDDMKDFLVGELRNYQKYIDDNDVIIRSHADYLRRGLRWGFLSPILLTLIGAAFFYYRHQ